MKIFELPKGSKLDKFKNDFLNFCLKKHYRASVVEEVLDHAMKNSCKIVVEFIYPPIPIRDHDWSASREDYDEGDCICTGRTKEEAVYSLLIEEFDSSFL